MYSITWKQ